MKLIDQKFVDKAFQLDAARNVSVVMKAPGEWYFTFEALDPLTNEPVRFSQKTQRGGLRLWRDPDNLFRYLLNRYGVQAGVFYLNKEASNGSDGSKSGKESG